MNEFKTYHPIVNFIYFVFVIGLSCFILHPLCLLVSFFCAFFYSAMLKGKKAVKANLLYVLPLMIIAALIAFAGAAIIKLLLVNVLGL